MHEFPLLTKYVVSNACKMHVKSKMLNRTCFLRSPGIDFALVGECY